MTFTVLGKYIKGRYSEGCRVLQKYIAFKYMFRFDDLIHLAKLYQLRNITVELQKLATDIFLWSKSFLHSWATVLMINKRVQTSYSSLPSKNYIILIICSCINDNIVFYSKICTCLTQLFLFLFLFREVANWLSFELNYWIGIASFPANRVLFKSVIRLRWYTLTITEAQYPFVNNG